MKRILLLGLVALAPVALFASEGAETNYDIVQRTVNFIIFAAILWYLLADKIKAFLANRTLSIQSELDKVQETLKAPGIPLCPVKTDLVPIVSIGNAVSLTCPTPLLRVSSSVP